MKLVDVLMKDEYGNFINIIIKLKLITIFNHIYNIIYYILNKIIQIRNELYFIFLLYTYVHAQ